MAYEYITLLKACWFFNLNLACQILQMYSNADTFIGSIECIMCNAIISPISRPKPVAKGKCSDSSSDSGFHFRSQKIQKGNKECKYNLYVWSRLVHIQYTPEGIFRHCISV